MTHYQPQRATAIERTIDVIEDLAGTETPRIIDLGGGTGTLCRELERRLPAAEITLVDLDPVLLAIAETHLSRSIKQIQADLRHTEWVDQLPRSDGYDVVVAFMALHYLPPHRLGDLYGQLPAILRPGGIFVNVDDMPLTGPAAPTKGDPPDADLPGTSEWTAWWAAVAAEPLLSSASSERTRIFSDIPSAEWNPAATWHVDALLAAGFTEVSVAWRNGIQAAVLARSPHGSLLP